MKSVVLPQERQKINGVNGPVFLLAYSFQNMFWLMCIGCVARTFRHWTQVHKPPTHADFAALIFSPSL